MLEQYKEQVITTAQRAQREGLCKHKAGNISVFDPESGYFLITPSGIDREKLTTPDICVLDLHLHQIEGGKPSSESLMHAACYRAREDIRAVVHTHSHMATAFAVLNKPVPATVYEMFVFHTENACIPVVPFVAVKRRKRTARFHTAGTGRLALSRPAGAFRGDITACAKPETSLQRI